MTENPTGFQRFLDAQEGRYASALDEIRRGTKRGHWMWFIFPQIGGLGHSETARRYAIASLEEARAYLAHPVLGKRLTDCVEALQGSAGTTAVGMFGEVDAMKLRSSLTLFSRAGGGPIFDTALTSWFGLADARTLEILGR